MKNNLISWGEVLKRYKISHQELVQLCNKGLQVFDKDENKIFATSQCKYTPVEPPVVTWGRILFDMEQDELIFDKECVENNLFKVKFFPKTGDFVLARSDIPPSIYDQNILAHLMNIEFPKELTQEFFKQIHKAGNESYLPSDKLKKEDTISNPIIGSLYEQHEFDNTTTITTIRHRINEDNEGEETLLRIPYILRQKYSLSEKSGCITFKLSKYSGINALDLSRPSRIKTGIQKTKITTRAGQTIDTRSSKSYSRHLQDETIELKYRNMQLLLFEINNRIMLAPHIEFISNNFADRSLPPMHDEKYETCFYNLCSWLGISSYIPTHFKLPEDTCATEKVFYFEPHLSSILKTSPFYDDNKVNNIKYEFFFQLEDILEQKIAQKTIDLQNKLFLIIENLQNEETTSKMQTSLKIAMVKFKTGKSHIEIYDEIYKYDKDKKEQAKYTAISRELDKVKKSLTKKFPYFPSSKKAWSTYKENPVEYLSQDEVFKHTPIK